MKRWRIVALAAAGILAAACADTGSDEALVARAGEQELTVEEAASLLVDEENLPNQTDVVRALADIWIDYTLLASSVARDSTLRGLDIEPLIRQQLEQELIVQHMDSVLQVDTAIAEDELRRAYETESPEAQLRASHILLGFPEQATAAQRDSVRERLEAIRRRALGGESFSDLARQYSQDPGSASQGGDLGTFSRGDMVRPFEEAALALEPGDISEIVETPFGLHVIRLESKEVPGFDSMRDAFRVRMQNQRFLSAESSYVASVEEARSPEIAENAFEVVKELAAEPGSQLSSRAAARPLVSFEGGAFTVGEYRMFVQGQQPQLRERIRSATDEQLENFLNGLAQREMLVAEARDSGMEPSAARVDSLARETRRQILTAAGEIGLRDIEQAPGEPIGPAIERAVRNALGDVLAGARDVLPLGPVSYQLRSRTPTTIYESGLGQTVLRIGQIRATRAPSPTEAPPDTGAAPDTSGGGTGTP